jgi:hypothetical protein
MTLQISNNAKVNNKERTAMSQQQLVNALLSEKQPTQAQPQAQQPQALPPVQTWGNK